MPTPLADNILQCVQSLNPVFVDLINESMNHANYFDGKESHFKLVIVSPAFVENAWYSVISWFIKRLITYWHKVAVRFMLLPFMPIRLMNGKLKPSAKQPKLCRAK